MSAFWQSPWSRVVIFLLGALAWRTYLKGKARWDAREKAAKAAKAKEANARSVMADYRTAGKDDPDAPMVAEAGILSDKPKSHEAWVYDMLRACVVTHCAYMPEGFQLSRSGRLYSLSYNATLEIFVYKTNGHKPITSSSLVTLLRRVDTFEQDTFATKK